MDAKLEGLSCPHKHTLQCPSLFPHCLMSKTQVLYFITENKILHIILEQGMLHSRTVSLDVTQLLYTALVITKY